jgi:hypothetical protein
MNPIFRVLCLAIVRQNSIEVMGIPGLNPMLCKILRLLLGQHVSSRLMNGLKRLIGTIVFMCNLPFAIGLQRCFEIVVWIFDFIVWTDVAILGAGDVVRKLVVPEEASEYQAIGPTKQATNQACEMVRKLVIPEA